MPAVWQSTEPANRAAYDVGGTHAGLCVGFVFRKPIKIPSIGHGADLLKQVVVAMVASA